MTITSRRLKESAIPKPDAGLIWSKKKVNPDLDSDKDSRESNSIPIHSSEVGQSRSVKNSNLKDINRIVK